MPLSAPNASSCKPTSSQSAAAGFLLPPMEMNSEVAFILTNVRGEVVNAGPSHGFEEFFDASLA